MPQTNAPDYYDRRNHRVRPKPPIVGQEPTPAQVAAKTFSGLEHEPLMEEKPDDPYRDVRGRPVKLW